jgi:Ca2+-binding RTX toxin-like protein
LQTITASETNAAGLTGYSYLTFTYKTATSAGSNGTQLLVGGAGDTLNGSKSADTFLFPPNFGNETINNFNVKNDVIDLPRSEFADFAAVQVDLHAVGNSVVLTLDANDSITLTHLQIQSLHAQNFHFF